MALRGHSIVAFGAFRLDANERQLIRDGQAVALTPKVFDLLVLLVEQPGHVLGKDELISALWQHRFVAESNLTKHVWMLRRALGESEESGRYIETVPKLGYRFVAPVSAIVPEVAVAAAPASALPDAADTLGSSPATDPVVGIDADETHVPASERESSKRAHGSVKSAPSRLRMTGVAGIAALLLVTTALVVAPRLRSAATGLDTSPPGTTVAIVQFGNLAQNPKDGWIGPALAQMLGTEIALGGRMHPLPQELVAPAESGLPAAQTGGYAPDSLATLRRRLGTDYVLSGSYLVAGTPEAPELRVDIALQDARSATALATFSHSGPVARLPALVAATGHELRIALGTSTAAGEGQGIGANAEPPTVEVMRRVGYAIDALHHYDPARARDELLEAVADAPTYAPAYAYLAQAWSALGYNGKAVAAARQAEAQSADLPQVLRLQIAVQRATTQFAWSAAIENLHKLIALDERDPEYRLQLVSTLLRASKTADAMIALDALRKLRGPVQNDPRIELAATRIAVAQGDAHATTLHAQAALEQATKREANGLIAEAQTQLAIARSHDDPRAAAHLFGQALANFDSVGNPHGEAWVHQSSGNLLVRSDPARARAEYELALAGSQMIGDSNGIAAAYSSIGNMLWASGDRDGAQTAVRHVLDIRRETADIAGEAWALAALANIGADQAASDSVVADFRNALALDEAVSARSHHAFTLFSLADTLRLRGELTEAAALCAKAQSEYAALDDLEGAGNSSLTCAQVALDRGELQQAEQQLGAARDAARKSGSPMTRANVNLMQGQIAIGRHQWSVAATSLAAAESDCAQSELIAGEAIAASMLALAEARLGNVSQRDAAAARAHALRDRVTEQQEVFAVDIAFAQLQQLSGDRARAHAALDRLATDALARRWIAWSLEARLAAVEGTAASPDTSAQRTALASDARGYGFGWILQRLQHNGSALST